jgi:hypothetical protein
LVRGVHCFRVKFFVIVLICRRPITLVEGMSIWDKALLGEGCIAGVVVWLGVYIVSGLSFLLLFNVYLG